MCIDRLDIALLKYIKSYELFLSIIINNGIFFCFVKEFNAIMEIVENKTGLAFYYNYLLSTQPPEFENYPKFLQKPDVRKSIHVGNLTYDDTR